MAKEGWCAVSVHEHQKESPGSIGCAVITVSDTRTKDTDKSGKLIRDLLLEHGHTISFYKIVKDEGNAIREALEEAGGAGGDFERRNGHRQTRRDNRNDCSFV
jgi:hypothetical protein